jgi:hypothetical protein
MKKWIIPYVVVLVALNIAAQVIAQTKTPKPAAEKPKPCVAAADEQCPTAQWLEDFERLQALNKKYAPPRDAQFLMKGLQESLVSNIPAGYDWNEPKMKFVRKPGQATNPVPQPPAKGPAPPPTVPPKP